MRTLSIALALTLSACAPAGKWVRPGLAPEQVVQAERECEYEASKATAGIANGFTAGFEQARLELQRGQ
mgnify:CR=1 FL=1